MNLPASGRPGLPLGDAAHLEPGLRGRPEILFYEGFAGTNWVADFAPEWGPQPADHGVVVAAPGAPSGEALRVLYPQGEIGGASGYQFLCRFPSMGLQARDEAWLRYYLRFDPGFDFVKGGKLPGLGGGEANTGGHPANGRDGWTARIMWRPDGRVVQYVYHVGQKGKYGDDLDWVLDGQPVRFTPGRWDCVETRVKLNEPGQADGVIQSWFNGRLALDARGLRFRDIPS
ncbi:MAG: polysaccharide lyase, partial [bacterium]